MAIGNTFGATALSSYGGFWIAYGILLTPHWNITGPGGPYQNDATKAIDPKMTDSALGFFLTGWFIFTTILLLCTLRSTVMFFLLFFTLDLAFLMLACGHYASDNGATQSALMLQHAGGGFGMLAAFLAWYNAFAGIADSRCVLSSFFEFSILCNCISQCKLLLPHHLLFPRLPPTRRVWFGRLLKEKDCGCIRQASDRKPLPSTKKQPSEKVSCRFLAQLR
jgi:succinate-acetate transporter protein